MAEPVMTMKVRDQEFPVYLRTSTYGGTPSGQFVADVEGKEVSAGTVEALYKNLMAETKMDAVEVDVPVSTVSGGRYGGPEQVTVRYGRIVKYNAQTEKATIVWSTPGTRLSDKDRQQIGIDYRTRGYYKPLSQEQAEELIRLRKASRDADNAVEAYEKEITLDLWNLLRDVAKAAREREREAVG
jgi:hypothetical protein